MSLRLVASVARTRDGMAAMLRSASALHTASANLAATQQAALAQEQQREPAAGQHQAGHQRQQLPPPQHAPAAPAATNPSAATAVVVRKPPESLLQRTLSSAVNAIHRLVLLVGSLRHLSANEAYVRRYLEKNVGFDSFTLEYLLVARPNIFRLSVAQDIEPVVSWLRSVGICGEELVELVRHTPTILSTSVDDQLEPLADLVRKAGGNPRGVLLAYPAIATVPLPNLRGTRHVLRQLGVAESDISLLLLSLPDLYAQLATTLQRLFAGLGVAAWKLHAQQRSQFAGLVHHQMARWNRHSRPHLATATATAAAATAAAVGPASDGEAEVGSSASASRRHPGGRQQQHSRRQQHSPVHGHVQGHGRGHQQHGSGGREHQQHGSGGSEQQRHQQQQGRSGQPARFTGGQRTRYLVDRDAYEGLVRVQAALETLALQPEGSEEQEAALSQLQHAIDMLEELGNHPSSQHSAMYRTAAAAAAAAPVAAEVAGP